MALHKGMECATQIASYLQRNVQLRSVNGRDVLSKLYFILSSVQRISILIELVYQPVNSDVFVHKIKKFQLETNSD